MSARSSMIVFEVCEAWGVGGKDQGIENQVLVGS